MRHLRIYILALGIALGFAGCMLFTSSTAKSLFRWQMYLPSSDASLWNSLNSSRLPEARDLTHLHAQNRAQETWDRIHGNALGGQDVREVRFEDLHVHDDDDSKAKELSTSVRVLVWVMTSPENLEKKAIHVRNTWGKRANVLLFMSSQWNSTFPTVGLNVSEGREHLTAKTMQAFRYVYDHHFHDAEWFMKTDDDTYVIMENLRYMLSSFSPKEPIYFGHAFKLFVKQGYASGGAGYVMSKVALRRLVTQGMKGTSGCKQEGEFEDVEMGKCLMKVGVKLMPSVDRLGRSRFHCFSPETMLAGTFHRWYLDYDVYGAKHGMDSISDYPVSFHYITPAKMYALEFFVYHLRPYGIVSGAQSLNLPQNHTRP